MQDGRTILTFEATVSIDGRTIYKLYCESFGSAGVRADLGVQGSFNIPIISTRLRAVCDRVQRTRHIGWVAV